MLSRSGSREMSSRPEGVQDTYLLATQQEATLAAELGARARQSRRGRGRATRAGCDRIARRARAPSWTAGGCSATARRLTTS